MKHHEPVAYDPPYLRIDILDHSDRVRMADFLDRVKEEITKQGYEEEGAYGLKNQPYLYFNLVMGRPELAEWLREPDLQKMTGEFFCVLYDSADEQESGGFPFDLGDYAKKLAGRSEEQILTEDIAGLKDEGMRIHMLQLTRFLSLVSSIEQFTQSADRPFTALHREWAGQFVYAGKILDAAERQACLYPQAKTPGKRGIVSVFESVEGFNEYLYELPVPGIDDLRLDEVSLGPADADEAMEFLRYFANGHSGVTGFEDTHRAIVEGAGLDGADTGNYVSFESSIWDVAYDLGTIASIDDVRQSFAEVKRDIEKALADLGAQGRVFVKPDFRIWGESDGTPRLSGIRMSIVIDKQDYEQKVLPAFERAREQGIKAEGVAYSAAPAP